MDSAEDSNRQTSRISARAPDEAIETLKIIDELEEKTLNSDSGFLDRLVSEWHNINSGILAHYGQRNYEQTFLNTLVEEIHRKLPDYTIVPFVRLRPIPAFGSNERAENVLHMELDELRRKMCPSGYSDQNCRRRKCFDGEYSCGTEIDGLIIRGEDFCFLEYENSRRGLCDNFMKMYRLRRLLSRDFESLFVTKVTTVKQEEGVTSFESFDASIDSLKPFLDTLLHHWKVLAIVDLLGSRKKRRFHWRP